MRRRNCPISPFAPAMTPRPTRQRNAQSPRAACAGSLGLFGLGLGDLLRWRTLAATDLCNPAENAKSLPKSFGRAKRCILLFMWGGPAHQDTWDLKPDAPAESSRRVQAHRHQGAAAFTSANTFARIGPADRQAGHRPLDDAQRRQPSDRRRISCSPDSRRRPAARSAAATGRISARCCRDSASGSDPLPPFVSLRPKLPNDVPRFVEESHGQFAGWLGQAFDPLYDRR